MNGEDEDVWEEDQPVDALPGSVSTADGSGAGELVLEMVAALSRLHVLLSETGEEEFARLTARLRLLKDLVRRLPTTPVSTGRIGFRL